MDTQREISQVGLRHFFLDLDNHFEHAAGKVINELENLRGDCVVRAQSMESLQEQNYERWKELQEEADRIAIDLDHPVNHDYLDTIYYKEELIAFSEMKIMYACKHLEN